MEIKKSTYNKMLREITLLKDQLRRQEQLIQASREQEDIYKLIWNHSLAGIYILQKGRFQIINPIALSFTGYDFDELIGKKSNSIIHPDDRERVKGYAMTMLSGELAAPYEFRIITKQRETCWIVESVKSTIFKGEPAIVGTAMDITLRKVMGEKWQDSEKLYRAIFENTGTATIIMEEDMTISLINSEFEKMTGYRKEEWEGKRKWPEYVAPDDIARMKRYHVQRRKDPSLAPRNYEHDLIDNKGRIRHMTLTVGMIPGTKKSIASFMDITEWKEAERNLKRRESELQVKSQSLQELNAALRVLLNERERDQKELADKIYSNIHSFVLPYTHKLRKSHLDPKDKSYVDIIESNLTDIISPFSYKISSKYRNLSHKEIQIANFIKEGKTSKEIADLLGMSKSAVDISRFRLRNKLGLNKVKVNLRSHLDALT
jgi:PAS domain S-box-containing protein